MIVLAGSAKMASWSNSKLFGWVDEPIRRALDLQRKRRLREMVGGPGLKLVELGCGGNPAAWQDLAPVLAHNVGANPFSQKRAFLADKCQSYTAVDFSPIGLAEAAAALMSANVAVQTVEADITDLPFDDDMFDVAYSAQAIYHCKSRDRILNRGS